MFLSTTSRSKPVAPIDLSSFVRRYASLLHLALESQAYRTQHDISSAVEALAEDLVSANAGPRDVISLHTQSLAPLLRGDTPDLNRAYGEEGRMVLFELMGRMMGRYRDLSMRSD